MHFISTKSGKSIKGGFRISQRRDANPEVSGHQPIIWPKFLENCMIMKKFGPGTPPKFYYVDPSLPKVFTCLLTIVLPGSVNLSHLMRLFGLEIFNIIQIVTLLNIPINIIYRYVAMLLLFL